MGLGFSTTAVGVVASEALEREDVPDDAGES